MVLIAVRDVLYRWRRFLVALIATAVVLALTLMLDGVNRSFPAEARRTVDAFHAGAWLVPEGAQGAFLSSAVLASNNAQAAAVLPGAEDARAVANLRAALEDGTDVNVIGLDSGSFADPPLEDGRMPEKAGEATAETLFGYDLGEEIELSGMPFTIVGHTDGLSFTAGVPSFYMPLADAQTLGYRGAALASAVVTKGVPSKAPDGLTLLDDAAVQKDLLAPLSDARGTIGLILGLLWLVAAMVIGSVVYLTSIDRSRDFAVFKATGATDRSILGSLAFQASLLSIGASALGVVLSFGLVPLLPMRTEVATQSYVTLAVVAVVVALLAALASARRTLQIDPALAFSGA